MGRAPEIVYAVGTVKELADNAADKAVEKAVEKFREEEAKKAEERNLRDSRVLRVHLEQNREDFPGDAVYWVNGAGDLHVCGSRGIRTVKTYVSMYSVKTEEAKYPYYEDPLGHFPNGKWTSVRYVEKES